MATAHLQNLHTSFNRHARCTASCVLPATLILITSIALIICGSLTLTLPGVNAMTQVITPILLPGCGGAVLSLPFLILSVRHVRAAARIRQNLLEECCNIIDAQTFTSKKAVREFVENQLVNSNASPNYKSHFFGELAKRYDDDLINKGLENAKALAMVPSNRREEALENIDESSDSSSSSS